MGEEKIKWHPAFAAAIQLEFKEYKEHLDYEIEHQLTKEPLRIDVVIIKKLDDIEIDKTTGKIFRKYNVMEYKSPTDYFSINDYYQVKAYAYLYKVLSEETNKEGENHKTVKIDIEDITISIVTSKYPQKLIKHLKEKQGINTVKIKRGIYYLKNTDIKTQIIVNNKGLDKKEAEYLKLLQKKQEDGELLKKWVNEFINNIKNPLYEIIMNVITETDPNEIMEVYKSMGVAQINESNKEFLLSMMKKMQLDKKLKEEGREEGIDSSIEIMKYLKMNKDIHEIVSLTGIKEEKVREVANLLKSL